jgi:hypothetical protein
VAFAALSTVLGAATVGALRPSDPAGDSALAAEPRWFRGNLHTHSFWSDGDDFPEMIVAWYKDHGYHFLGLSDHNILSDGEKWLDAGPDAKAAVAKALPKYRERFGAWVEETAGKAGSRVRLKPLSEFRALFDEPGKFLLVQSEEITDKLENLPIHLNATNLRDLIKPQGGNSVLEVMQNNVNAVIAERQRTGRPILVHLNHPNYGWAVTADELAQVKGERFFEVFNGHPGVRNYGDETHAGTERMWDLVLAARLTQPDGEVLYGLATDDSHNYHEFGLKKVNPGRGWVVVRARHLTPDSIIAAMERGDFYASTGVRMSEVEVEGDGVCLAIDGELGVTYRTEFIGTLAANDAERAKVKLEDIGRVLAVSNEMTPEYKFTGRELYVRARVTSSKPHPNPYAEGDFETAWIQPVRPGAR